MTQVRVGGMGGVIGFDYPAVQIVADAHDIELSRGMWAKIRAVEMAMVRSEAKKQQAAG